ncbi:hypothetical protein GCM10023091_25350 [Ravibacter arvi]|uniref:Lipoprotein n=1 Tax=Ravibacter arvi TaxID=2051041 RepID=A0ABP8M2B9_9BACT
MKYFLLAPVFYFLFSSCSRSDTPTPKAQVYVYADIDGKPFRYEGEDNYVAENRHWGYRPIFYFGCDINEYEGFALGTTGSLSGKPETLDVLGALYSNSRFDTYASGFLADDEERPFKGKCTITRVTNDFVEGTFYVDVYSEYGKGSKTLKVTNGRFRVKYN